MPYTLGKNAKLWITPDGATAGTNWVRVRKVRDLEISNDLETTDESNRDSGGYKQVAPGLKDGSITFDVEYDLSEATYVALQTAWDTGAAIGAKALDGVGATHDSGNGVVADFIITSFKENQPLSGAMVTSVTLQITSTDFTPVRQVGV